MGKKYSPRNTVRVRFEDNAHFCLLFLGRFSNKVFGRHMTGSRKIPKQLKDLVNIQPYVI